MKTKKRTENIRNQKKKEFKEERKKKQSRQNVLEGQIFAVNVTKQIIIIIEITKTFFLLFVVAVDKSVKDF